MKATDLMIGDWVQIVSDAPTMANEYHRIDWIRTGEIGLDNRKIVTYPFIQPIPLTPEILEKNGWQYFSGSPCSVYQLKAQGGYYISLYSCIEGRFEIQISGLWFEIQFVHELQHALRLCGIEKEMEL